MGNTSGQPPSLRDALLRRPFFSVAAIFILGVFVHSHLPPRPPLYISVAAALLIITLFARAVPIICDIALAGAIFSAALAAAQIQAFYYPPHHISHFATAQPRLATIELHIDQAPRIVDSALASQRRLPPRQVTQATVLRILTASGWQEATGRTTLQINSPHPDLAIAQRVVAFGMLHRPAPAMNPGQFDFAAYYRDQRILTSFSIPSPLNLRIVSSPGPGLLDRLRQIVRNALQHGFTEARSLDHALLRALLLGDSDPQLRDVQDDFVRTGTIHHLAISGMHIAILGGFVLIVCRLLLLRPRLAIWISLVFVILYGLVALPSPPVVRSVLLCIAFCVGMLSRRSIDGVQLLSLSVFAMLVYQPLDLFNAGFQLSFGVVLGLMVLAKPALAFLTGPIDIDQQLARPLQKPTTLRLIVDMLRQRFLEGLVAGVVAWIVAAPLIAFHFSQINPYAIPASLLLAIPVILSLIAGFLKIMLTLLIPPLAGLLATFAAAPVALMRRGVDLLSQIPGSDAPLAAPPIWSIVAFYLLLALPLLPRPHLRLRPFLRCGPAIACHHVLGLPLHLGSAPQTAPRGQLRLVLLSVGTGQCAILHLPSGKTVLVDAGSASVSDLDRKCITPYLKALGQRRIDSLFISHANNDHFSAADDAIANHDIRQLFLSPLFAVHAANNASAESLMRSFASHKCTLNELLPGQHLSLDNDVALDVLWPPADLPLAANDASLVLRLTCFGRSILLPGDIQDLAQAHLLSRPDSLRCDVLIAPHHGSSVPTTGQFLTAVNPQLILSSNDHSLSQKQRAFDKLASGRFLYRTHTSGAISLTIGRQGNMRLDTHLAPAASPRSE